MRSTRRVKKKYCSMPAVFDDTALLANAGLPDAMDLADRAGLERLLSETDIQKPNTPVKIRCVVAGMLSGADNIDGLDRIREGAADRVWNDLRAPSTLGTFLRDFDDEDVDEVRRLCRRHAVALAHADRRIVDGAGWVFTDVDDTRLRVYGKKKEKAAYSNHNGQTMFNLNVLFAILSTGDAVGNTSRPMILDSILRPGNSTSSPGSPDFLTTALESVHDIHPNRIPWVRSDSAFHSFEFVDRCLDAGAVFSIGIPQQINVKRVIRGIPVDAWADAADYPTSHLDANGNLVLDAQVAEIDFTDFVSVRKGKVPLRLVVRRVFRLDDRLKDEPRLFDDYQWRYHAFVSNVGPEVDAVTLDSIHRDHAIVEQVISEEAQTTLAHMPSGVANANAAWLVMSSMALNIARAVAVAAEMPTAVVKSVIHRLIRMPGRVAESGRQMVRHCPENWKFRANHDKLSAFAGTQLAHAIA